MEHPLVGRLEGYEWLFPMLATLGGLCSIAYSIRLVGEVFFGPESHELPQHPHDPPAGMWAPVATLVAICVVVGVAPAWFQSFVFVVAESAIGGPTPEYKLALWHGLTPALGMTGVALVGGALLYRKLRSSRPLRMPFEDVSGKALFEASWTSP